MFRAKVLGDLSLRLLILIINKMQERAADFLIDVMDRFPMDQMRLKYTTDDIKAMMNQVGFSRVVTLERLLDWYGERYTPAERAWVMEFFPWFLNVSQYPRDGIQMTWGFCFDSESELKKLGLVLDTRPGALDNYVAFECSLLDWVCISQSHLPAASWMLDYLLRNKYRGKRTLGWCLAFMVNTEPDGPAMIQRLLDAGAQLDWMHDASSTAIMPWYASRQRRRQQCWALLASWRHGPLLKRWMPRDVIRLIVQALWAQRWTE